MLQRECTTCRDTAATIQEFRVFMELAKKHIRTLIWRVDALDALAKAGNLPEIQRMLTQLNEELFGYIPEHEREDVLNGTAGPR